MRQFRNRSLSDFEYRRNLLSRYGYNCDNDQDIWNIYQDKY